MNAGAAMPPSVQRTGTPLSRSRRLYLGAFTLLVLTGCAQPRRAAQAPQSTRSYWSGRLGLQVEGQASQSFTAAFELQGNATQGALTLLSPLGNVLAHLQWEPGHAWLESGNDKKNSSSLDELLLQATGSSLPVSALFSWLAGQQASAAGWQADLSALEQGRLTALREEPAPRTTLRIAFED